VSHPAVRYAKTVDGLHIAYQIAGEGAVDLVYAPGWFSNLEAIWDVPDLGDFLREAASSFRLILLDRRGFGLSDWPITTGSLSLELGMDDVRAVMDAAGSERAVLFGFDDGGALCTLFAASYPERVSALVLFAVWAKYYASSDYPWRWTTDEAEEWWQLVDRHWGTERFWEANSAIVDPAIRQDPDEVLDAFLTGAGARTEHYEIAAYEGLVMMADAMGEDEVARLLSENLEEEKAALTKMQAIATRLAEVGVKATA
jgi:pimeloyl-ACP methyl ester carboxylesterase